MNASAALLAHIDIPPKLLVSLIVLVLALIIWGIVAAVNRGSKPSHIPQGGPACPTCGSFARWAYTHWVCDRCQRALPPPGQHPGMPQMGGPGMPPGQQMGPGMMPGQQMGPGMPGQQMGAPGQMPPGQMPMGAPNMAQPGMPPQSNPHMAPGMPAPRGAMDMAAAPQVTCSTCRGPGRWIPESNGWGCDRCRQMIQPA